MIKGVWNKIKKQKNFKVTRLVLVIIFFITFFLIGSYLIFYNIVPDGKRRAILYYNPFIATTITNVKKITDILYLPYFFEKSDLQLYSLSIKESDIKKMTDSLPKNNTEFYTSRIYVPASLKVNDKSYAVKIRIRGDASGHWANDKKSYLIEFDNDNLLEGGISRLSFIIPSDRDFVVEHFNNYRGSKFGLMHPESDFGILKINGKNYGVYFLVENWSAEMIAKWGVPDESNFYSGDYSYKWIEGAINDEAFDNLGPWNKQQADNRFNFNHYSEMHKLLELVNNATDDEFKNKIFYLIDKNNFFNWLIHQNLSNSIHQNGHNLRLYFNNSTGKFYFIPWDVGMYPVEEGVDRSYNKIVSRILSIPEYMHERNLILWNYVSDEKNIEDDLRVYDKIYDRIKIDIYKGRGKLYSNKDFDYKINENRKNIIDNYNHLKDNLEDVSIVASIIVGNNSENNNLLARFEIKTDSFSELLFRDLELEFLDKDFNLSKYNIYYDINENNLLDIDDKPINDEYNPLIYTKRYIDGIFSNAYKPELTNHTFFLVSDEINLDYFLSNLVDFKINLINAVTQKKIKQDNIKTRIIADNVYSNFEAINNFTRENKIFTINQIKKEIILKDGVYSIDKDLIIPSGYTVIISPGVILYLAEKVSVISYSPILAEGTELEPITFTAQDKNKNWGNVFILNNKERNIFKNTIFEYGGDSYTNGAYASGMLAFHNTGSVIVEDSIFKFASGDDALNVKWGDSVVRNNVFDSNGFDAIDLDWANNSLIENNTFVSNGNDAIDIGGGKNILVKNNLVENSGDKCISIGENATDVIIFNNILTNCLIGIGVKDKSSANIINNTIINNETGITLYQKKPVWGGATASVYNSIISGVGESIIIDDKSEISVKNSSIKNGYEGEENMNIVPELDNNYRLKDKSDIMNRGNKEYLDKFNLEIIQGDIPLGKIF